MDVQEKQPKTFEVQVYVEGKWTVTVTAGKHLTQDGMQCEILKFNDAGWGDAALALVAAIQLVESAAHVIEFGVPAFSDDEPF